MELYQYLKHHTSYDLEHVVKEMTVQKDEHIYIPGQMTNSMYEILSGVIKLGSYGTLGQEVTYDILVSPDTFGNMKYLNGQFFEFAKTAVPTRLRVYQLDFFKKIVTEEPKVSEWSHRNIVRRWSIAEARLLHIRSYNKSEKIEAVCREFDQTVKDAEGRTHNLLSLLTMQDLGDLTGMTRQTVSQTLKKIQSKKLKVTA